MRKNVEPLITFLQARGMKYKVEGNICYFKIDGKLFRVWAPDNNTIILYNGLSTEPELKTNNAQEIINYIKKKYGYALPQPSNKKKHVTELALFKNNRVLITCWYPVKIIWMIDDMVEEGLFANRSEAIRFFLRLGILTYMKGSFDQE